MKTEFNATVKIKKSVEYYPLSQHYSAFRLVTDSDIISSDNHQAFNEFSSATEKIGIASVNDIMKFCYGSASSIDDNSDLMFVSDEFLASLQQIGYSRTIDKFDDTLNDIQKNLMSLWSKPGYQLVRMYRSGHMVFDLADRPLPMAIRFDYIDGGITNEDYDLEQVISVLKQNQQVRGASNSAIAASEIPWYNRESNRSKAVEFVFSPTFEQMQQIWQTAQQLNARYPSTEIVSAVKTLDLLKLNICKKQK